MTHPTLRTPSFDDSQAKFKPKTFRQRVSNLSSLKIICLLIFFSLLLPFVAICLFMGTATVFKHQWAEKDHARGKLPPRPRPPAVPKAPAAPAALSTKSDGKTGDATTAATKTAAVAADPTNSGSSHFLIEKRNIAVHHCIDRRQRPKVSRDLTENTPITVPVRSVDEHAIYQLCFADDHPHQHTFKLKVKTNATFESTCMPPFFTLFFFENPGPARGRCRGRGLRPVPVGVVAVPRQAELGLEERRQGG